MKEDQLLKQMKIISGRGSIPDAKSYNLEQPAGRDWREFRRSQPALDRRHRHPRRMLALLVIFYLMRGMVKIENGRSGRMIVRFNAFERFVHWMTATCFVVLAITGLNITFGRQILLPLIGPDAFSTWSQWGKYAHNYLSFPFTLGVVLILLMWIAGNIPNQVDVEWVKRGGGIVGNDHPPAYRFNAGQKMIYWIVVLGGGAVAISGYLPDVPVLRHRHRRHAAGPDRARRGRGAVRRRHARPHLHRHHRHGGRVRGAWRSARSIVNWAKQHHDLWLARGAGQGRTRRIAAPAAPPHATPAE